MFYSSLADEHTFSVDLGLIVYIFKTEYTEEELQKSAESENKLDLLREPVSDGVLVMWQVW